MNQRFTGADHRVSPLRKEQLQFRYANGPTANDNPAYRAVPDSVLLNRHEWYEVLYYVNKFANDYGEGRPGVALKAERLIQKHLPADIRSHVNVANWLLANWDTYGDAPL